MNKNMEPRVTLLIKKENKIFIILRPSVLRVDAVILDDDITNHSWMTLQEIG